LLVDGRILTGSRRSPKTYGSYGSGILILAFLTHFAKYTCSQEVFPHYLQLSQLGANILLLAQKLERLLRLFGQALQKRSVQKSSLP
jgi:hypothetical protein